jgi:hypothetical protein
MSCRLPRGASPRSDRADQDCHAAGINPKLGVAAWLSTIARVIATWLMAVAVLVLNTLDAIPSGRGLVGGSDDDNGDKAGQSRCGTASLAHASPCGYLLEDRDNRPGQYRDRDSGTGGNEDLRDRLAKRRQS